MKVRKKVIQKDFFKKAAVLLFLLTAVLLVHGLNCADVQAASLTLHPSGADTDNTVSSYTGGTASTVYDSNDGNTSTGNSSGSSNDYYLALDDHGSETGVINSVIVRTYVRRDSGAWGGDPTFTIGVKTNGSNYFSGSKSQNPTTYSLHSGDSYTTNPQSASAWTWSEIDSLVAIINHTNNEEMRATEIYVDIDYDSPPTLNIDEPDGTSDTVNVGDNYSIQYDLSDSDDTVTVAFYYDSDNSGLDGTAITGACATAAEGTNATCTWDTTGMTAGTYYVYGITNDGTNPDVTDYSSGQITIYNPPTLTVDEPDGTSDTVTEGDNYSIQYDLADSDDVVTAAFYYDSDNSGLDGTAITGACATAAEGTDATCTWDTTGMTAGTYYVYGVTNDGTNPDITDYSSGQITINDPPTLNVDEPDGTGDTVTAGDNYSIQYDLSDSDDVVTVAFYYDSDNSGLDGTPITGACATAAEGTDATCTWDTTGMVAGSYYVYGIADDGTATQVTDYSPGQITINAASSTTAEFHPSGATGDDNATYTSSAASDLDTNDGNTTTGSSTGSGNDYYLDLDDRTTESGPINSVIIKTYVRKGSGWGDGDASFTIGVKTNGSDYFSSTKTATSASFTLFSGNTYNTNPQSGSAWTWTEIDNLVAIINHTDSDGMWSTELYAEVDYGPNVAPTLNIDDPDGTSDTVTEGDNYSIQYDLSDSDDTVTVAFYYDSNNSGLNGTAITGACATAAEGTNATCTWDTTGMTQGTYYVYGIANDGTNPDVGAYSPGQITIYNPPTLNIDEPDGTSDAVAAGTNYSIQYDLSDTEDVVTVAFYYDTDNSGLDGTAITGACATAAEGTDATCTWDTTGMSDGTYYIYGISDDGFSPQVSDYSSGQITIDSIAPADVTDLSIGGRSDNWLILYWTAPGDDGSSGTATTYDIRYRTDAAITSGNWDTATQVTGEPSPSVAGSSENFTVTGLSGGTTYYFAIKTADEVPNWSGVSNSPTNSTYADTWPPVDITDLATGTVTSSSVLLTWTAPGDTAYNGTATTYDVRYSTSTITAGNWGSATQATGEPAPAASGTSESFNVTGLSSGQTYYFAIKTSDEVPNESGLSNVPSAQTLSGIQTCNVDPTGTYIEAEDYTGSGSGTTHQFSGVLTTQAGYRGTGYIEATTDNTNDYTDVNNNPGNYDRYDYQLNFPTTGTYTIWIRGYAAASGSASDSIFVGLDSTAVGALTESGDLAWEWTKTIFNGGNTFTVSSPGTAKINIWPRETAHKIDAIYITKGAETPTDSAHGIEIDPSNCDSGTLPVYYSVGQNTSDHKTGSPTVTISSGTATFSTGQTATNMGVGDKITYDTSSVAYISGKLSSTQWTVTTARSAIPNDVTDKTVNSITHAYASLSAAEAGASDSSHLDTTDLVTGKFILNFPTYYDSGADTTAVTVDGWTTGASNYIKIYAPNNKNTEVNQTQRHDGTWDSTAYNLDVGSGSSTPLTISDDHVRIDGLQIKTTYVDTSTTAEAIDITGAGNSADIRISNTLLNGGDVGTGSDANRYGIIAQSVGTTSTLRVWNNIMYEWGAKGYGMYINDSDYTAYVYNNTLYDNQGYGINVNAGSVVAKNNLVYGSGNTNTYTGTFASGTDYNATDSTDAIGQGSNNRTGQTFTFADDGSDDFRLDPSDRGAIDFGTDLSADSNLAFNDDIENGPRPFNSVWDIGADEAAALTAVELVKFNAIGMHGNVLLTWKTASEIDNAGFNLYRATTVNGPYEKINTGLIPGLLSSALGRAYQYVDAPVTNGAVYYYKLEDIDLKGRSTMHGPVMARPGLDSDGDRMTDDWEIYYGLDPYDPADAALDPDGDGKTNLEEFLEDTDPTTADSETDPPREPGLKILESNDRHMVMELTTAAYETGEKTAGGELWQTLNIPDYIHGYREQTGSPRLPAKAVLIGVPKDATVSLRILESESTVLEGYYESMGWTAFPLACWQKCPRLRSSGTGWYQGWSFIPCSTTPSKGHWC
jgi:hypothetical protein